MTRTEKTLLRYAYDLIAVRAIPDEAARRLDVTSEDRMYMAEYASKKIAQALKRLKPIERERMH